MIASFGQHSLNFKSPFIIHAPRTCTDTKIGVLPPNWGDGAKYLQNEIVFGVNATRWFGSVEHSFDVAADAPFLPVRFGFPQPAQDLYFDTHSFSYALIDDAVFRVPADCTRACK